MKGKSIVVERSEDGSKIFKRCKHVPMQVTKHRWPNPPELDPHLPERMALQAHPHSASHFAQPPSWFGRLFARSNDPRIVATLLGSLLLLAIWATTIVLIRTGYRTAEQQAAATTRELVHTYEAHALRAIREIDHALRTVEYAYELVGEVRALTELRERELLPPELLFEVSIADEHGTIVASTSKDDGNVSQQDFFTQTRARNDLFIARPQRGATPDERKLLFSRALDRPDGRFAGVVFIAVDAAYFVSSYDADILGNQGLLALIGTDSIVRARRVGNDVTSGDEADVPEVIRHPGETEPAIDSFAMFDGIERYVSARELSGFPIAVVVGLSRDEQLAAMHQRMLENSIIAVLVSALVIVVVATFGRLGWKLAKVRLREQQMRLTAARESGMAEIATNVLHNVGNALNSVNVAATLVSDHFRQPKAAGLTRAVALLRDHEARLSEFLTSDARGKHLPTYLHELDKALQADQVSCLAHVDTLQKSIEHIKRIVMMQQMLAKPSAVREEVDVNEMMEACLQMNVDALGRHSVNVVREFESMPTVVLDKHGVMQILVNLISNAKNACSESARSDKLIVLNVRRRGEWIEFRVADNGVGIPAENLTRIFQYGFTTRSTGHGFGLHSSALTARDLGGSLQAHSDGVGLGAMFTLALPLDIAEAAA